MDTTPSRLAARPVLDLTGPWAFQLDPEDRGEHEGWYQPDFSPQDQIRVPGVWQAQGFGEPRSELRYDYQGKAWYQRRLTIPEDWHGRRIWLDIGGVLRRAKAFVNGQPVGRWDLITTPFKFDITTAAQAGADNVITIQVDNLPRSGQPSTVNKFPGLREWDFSEPVGAFNSINNWGGIYRKVELHATDEVWIEWLDIRPDIDSATATVRIRLDAADRARGMPVTIQVSIITPTGQRIATQQLRASAERVIETTMSIPQMHQWTPEDTYLYTCQVDLLHEFHDSLQQRFGMVKFSAQGNRFLLNNKPYYLRGFAIGRGDVLEGMIPVDKEVYRQRFRMARDRGFNHIRWHSTIPPVEAFEAADEVGMLMQAELPVVFTGFFMPHVNQLHRELEQVLLTHRNHPSLLAVAFGNEFNLKRDFDSSEKRAAFVREVSRLYEHGKRLAPHRFIMSNSGYALYPSDMVSAHAGFVTDRPTVKHESGTYKESLPDIDLVERFTGVLRAEKLLHKRQWVHEHNLTDIYPQVRRNSERLQQAARKWHFERTRQIPDLCGYQYWLMADSAPDPQMDSLEDGILNYFWEPTKAVSEEEMCEINGPIALLLTSDVNDRTFWAHEGKTLGLVLSHYGEQPLHSPQISWRLQVGSEVLATDTQPTASVPMGEVRFLMPLSIPPLELTESKQLELIVELTDDSGQQARNRWSLWAFHRNLFADSTVHIITRLRSAWVSQAYPFTQEAVKVPQTADLLITSALDAQAFYYLRNGGKVLWLAQSNQFDQQVRTDYFSPSLAGCGTYIEDHPAMTNFPCQRYCDLQFFNLMEGGFALPIPEDDHLWMLSAGATPGQVADCLAPSNTMTPLIWGIRVVGEWTSRERSLERIAWIVEANVGEGRLLLTTLNLLANLDEAKPEAVCLFDSLLRYATSEHFQPSGQMSEEELSGLLTPYVS